MVNRPVTHHSWSRVPLLLWALPILGLLSITVPACRRPEPAGRRVVEDATSPELSHAGLRPELLKSQVIFEDARLTMPYRMVATPAGLVVLNPYSDPRIFLVAPAAGRVVGTWGRGGGGPGEFRFPNSVSMDPKEASAIWIGDPNQVRFTRVELDSRAGFLPDSIDVIALPGIAPFGDAEVLEDGTFLVNGALVGARFRILNPSGDVTSRFGLLADSLPGYPREVSVMADEETFDIRPAGGLLAAGTLMGGELRIYGVGSTRPPRSARTPFAFGPVYRVGEWHGQPSLQPQASTRYGYLDVVATNDSIIALFSGRTLGGFGQHSAAGRFLHVFDWQGQLLRVYELPEPVVAIALALDGQSLFGARWEPTPAVVRLGRSAGRGEGVGAARR